MGRRGPAPEPVAAKLARGETRPSRINREAPQPRIRKPSAPDWTTELPSARREDHPAGPEELRHDAAHAWELIVREMPPGVIVALDGLVLQAFCETWARYRQALRAYALTGPVVRSRRGSAAIIRSPVAPLVRDALEQVRLLGRELGLTPAARAALRMDPGSQIDSLEDVLGPPPRLRVVSGE